MFTGSVTVRGNIRLFGPLKPLIDRPVIRVRIRDVSLIDLPAVCIAEQGIPLGVSPSGGVSIPFELAFTPKHGASYALEAHLPRAGTDTIAAGDLITMESYPIPTDRAESVLDVIVRQVR